MKKIIFIIQFFSLVTFAQEENDKLVYLDSLWKETTNVDYYYYRIIKDYKLEKEDYVIEDYYKSGKLQMKGKSEFKDNINKKGEFNYYFENGSLKENIFYDKGIPIGNYSEWYESGQKYIEGEYIKIENNNILKIKNYWDEQNIQKVIDGNGVLEEKSKIQKASGKIKDGFKDGVWIGENSILSLTYTENYSYGKLISGVSIDKDGVKHEYTEVEKQPVAKYGIDDFRRYIGKNFKVNNLASKKAKSGKIFVKFVVDKEGKLTDIEVIKGLGYGLDEEAIRVMKEYTIPWIPAEQRGVKVRCYYMLPITLNFE